MPAATSNPGKSYQPLLDRYQALLRICKSPDYQEHLKPILMEAFHNKWPDPSQSQDLAQFHKQYSEQYGRAMAFKEIYNMIETAEKASVELAKQMALPKKDYGLST